MERRDLLKMACVAPLVPSVLLGEEKEEELKSNNETFNTNGQR